MSKQKHILVIRFSAMGDVAMIIPVLRALTKQHPYLNITVLTRPFFTPFFRELHNVKVIPIDLEEEYKGVLGLYKLLKVIKSLKANAIADLHNVLRTNVLKLFLFKQPFKQIDKGRKEKKKLVSGKYKQLKTTHQRYAAVFLELGYKIDLTKPTFLKPKTIPLAINSLLGELKEPLIGIAPFAQYASKMYPLDLMENLIKELSRAYKIVLFGGGKKEIGILNNFEAKYNNVINCAGKLTLNEELDVISNLNLMVSMDSGNAHIAAFLGKKVITIWGVTHPFAGFSPFNQPKENSILSNRNEFPKIPTSIYGNKFPDNYIEVTRSIPVNKVIERIKIVLKEESLTNEAF